ncbi:PREDICTED: endocuticle structural glycoprotein SgAbd-2-like [Polistes canadensis]|uniref:endocuticle structural glycoprotein SgAbd-2-like n=1 Tax=Polistes canadensis TaxID=91411 RepID=UPI000718FC0E|nr:PREDICTED: endocuticle structural glycoprotein SgAbd-2-like [Polistes canadensis]
MVSKRNSSEVVYKRYKMATNKIILLSMLAMTMTMAANPNEPIAIVSQSQEINPDGSFHAKWETANGITVEEHGNLKNIGQKDEAEEVQGSAAWTAPDGTKINLGWLANENGAVFEGSHLPTPPPPQAIPAAIQRALDWIAANPYKEDSKNKL